MFRLVKRIAAVLTIVFAGIAVFAWWVTNALIDAADFQLARSGSPMWGEISILAIALAFLGLTICLPDAIPAAGRCNGHARVSRPLPSLWLRPPRDPQPMPGVRSGAGGEGYGAAMIDPMIKCSLTRSGPSQAPVSAWTAVDARL